ncbi:MAG: hypothetical protein LKF32_01750 [Mageeibacillus sp.]|jgi:hypothetical protein|nr:hypothetical protein [Mageeibacillus sp.]
MSTDMKKYKSFEQLASDIKNLNEQWKNVKIDANKELTFAGIQKKIQNIHTFIANERKTLNSDIDNLKELWSAKVVEEHKQELTQQFEEMVQTLIQSERKEIATLISSKMNKIEEMISTAPTEDQLRLLQALQMRGDLDLVEVTHILPMFFGNYQAMKVLQSVSERNGFQLHTPVQLDCREMYETLNEANDFLMGACNEVSKKINNMTIEYHAFYTVNSKESDKQYDPKYQQYIDLFDTTPQLQDCKTEKTALSPTEKARVDWYFREVAALDPTTPGDDTTILNKVSEVIKNNPDIAELLPYTEYEDYVSALELIKAEQEE